MSMSATQPQSPAELSTTARRMSAIADQLNLLAFNAEIDNARATAGGYQFSVVANQVQELALTPLAHNTAS